jgi:hypothetical protein
VWVKGTSASSNSADSLKQGGCWEAAEEEWLLPLLPEPPACPGVSTLNIS